MREDITEDCERHTCISMSHECYTSSILHAYFLRRGLVDIHEKSGDVICADVDRA